ncbi:META domain-containing protein [Salegentibacter sp. F14]
MKKLIFVLSFSFLFFSCKKDSDYDNPSNLENKSGNYDLVNLDGEDVSSEGFTLELESKKQRLSGKTGCNNFVVTYEIEKKHLKFNPPFGTKMFCQGKMEYEETFEDILPKIKKVKISEEELVFLSEENNELLKLEKSL